MLRRFTPAAIRGLAQDFDRLTTIGYADLDALLTDPELTTVVEPEIEITIHYHRSRLQLADYLWEALQPLHGGSGARILGDAGLWTWLAFAHMDVIAPLATEGRRLGERGRWIVGGPSDRARFARHLILGPFSAYAAHADDPQAAMVVLGGRMSEYTEVARELSGRRDLLVSRAVVALATELYVNPLTGLPKRGAATKGPGGVRRYVDVMLQFDLVYDLHSIDIDTLRSLLPPEFDAWRDAGDRAGVASYVRLT